MLSRQAVGGHLYHVNCTCIVKMATPREGHRGSNCLINVCCRSLELNKGLETVIRLFNGTDIFYSHLMGEKVHRQVVHGVTVFRK